MAAPAGGVLMTMHRVSLGGADRVGILIANAIARAGIPIRLALLRDGGEGEAALFRLLDRDVERSSAGPATGSRHAELLRGYRFLQREIADWRPSLVLASSNNMGLVTGLAARRSGTWRPRLAMKFTNPVIRPQDGGALRQAYRRRLYRFVLGQYERVLTLSDAEQATLSRLYPDYAARFHTVANPYVSEAMLDSRPAPRAATPLILAVGRMMPQKRFDRLLHAFARLDDTSARLTILGDGPLRGELEALARTLGIAERVTMPGFVEDVVPWLAQADLFALSSDYEGFPAAVLEALACNLPVVTTDCFDGAHALLADAALCAVVPRADVDDLARAMAASLGARAVPAVLRERARPYAMAHALAAHVDVLAAMCVRPA